MLETNSNKEQNIELKSEEFQEILGDTPSWILRRGMLIIIIVISFLLIGSALFKYPDTISTTMTLTGSSPAIALVARVSGRLHEINVTDKQQVKKGECLAVIENPAQTTDVFLLKKYLSSMNVGNNSIFVLPSKNLQLGNMQTIYSSFYKTLYDYIEFIQREYYPKKISYIQKRIYQYEMYYKSLFYQKTLVNKQMHLARKQYIRDSILDNSGLISQEVLETTEDHYLQSYLSLESKNSTLQSTEIQITQMKEDLLDIQQEYQDKRTSLEIQLKTYTAQLMTEIQTWEQNYLFISPINGIVTFTNYWAKNQNVTNEANVFNIVPNVHGVLMGKASMDMKKSGKVKVGQKANIHFLNFIDNEYGIVRGIVKNISLVPIKDSENNNNYTVEIELPEGLKTSYNKELPYLPGMQAYAEIVTNNLSLLERLFLPLKKKLKNNK